MPPSTHKQTPSGYLRSSSHAHRDRRHDIHGQNQPLYTILGTTYIKHRHFEIPFQDEIPESWQMNWRCPGQNRVPRRPQSLAQCALYTALISRPGVSSSFGLHLCIDRRCSLQSHLFHGLQAERPHLPRTCRRKSRGAQQGWTAASAWPMRCSKSICGFFSRACSSAEISLRR